MMGITPFTAYTVFVDCTGMYIRRKESLVDLEIETQDWTNRMLRL